MPESQYSSSWATLALDDVGDMERLDAVQALNPAALVGLRQDGLLRVSPDDAFRIGPEFAHDEVRRLCRRTPPAGRQRSSVATHESRRSPLVCRGCTAGLPGAVGGARRAGYSATAQVHCSAGVVRWDRRCRSWCSLGRRARRGDVEACELWRRAPRCMAHPARR